MKTNYIKGAINILLIPLLVLILLIGISYTSTNANKNILVISISTLIITFILIKSYLSKKQTSYNISQYIAIFINIILIFSIYNLNNEYSYLSNIITNEYQYQTNNILVLKNTKYNNNKQLNNKKIGVLSNNIQNTSHIINKNITNIDIIEYKNQNEMFNDLYEGQIQSIVLNENEVKILKNNYNKIIKDTKTIYEIKIKSEI